MMADCRTGQDLYKISLGIFVVPEGKEVVRKHKEIHNDGYVKGTKESNERDPTVQSRTF